MKKRTVPVWAALMMAILLTGCSPQGFGASPPGVDFHSGAVSEADRMVAIEEVKFTDLAELADFAHLVVVGTFDRPLERVDLAGPGLWPVQVWSFTVDDVLKRDAEIVRDRNPRTIRVEQYDFTRIRSEDLSNVASEGARAILFLVSYRQSDSTYGVIATGQGAILVTEDGTLRAAPNASEPLARQIEGLRDRAAFFEAMSG